MFSKGKSKTSKSNKAGVNEATINSLFDSLADEDDREQITMEGISKIAESLSIDASSDVRILVLVWKLGSKAKPGTITREEFVAGMTNLNTDSLAGLQSLLPTFDPGFLDTDEFRGSVYCYTSDSAALIVRICGQTSTSSSSSFRAKAHTRRWVSERLPETSSLEAESAH